MAHDIPTVASNINLDVGANLFEFRRVRELEDRRLYLYGEISSVDEEADDGNTVGVSMVGDLVESILNYNRADEGLDPDKREPIRLYINSPGGKASEGFSLVDAMTLSKTPIYTINLGEWYSMAFLIGITGDKRFSLPSSTFMMHEPSGIVVGKISDMADTISFNKRFHEEVIRQHVLGHSTMSIKKYKSVSSKDFYMSPEDALGYGFIDEIVTDISVIL